MKTKKIWLAGIAFFMLLCSAIAQTTTVNGLVVVVNFNDYKLKATMTELEDMFNKPTGFNLWGNETSVREYFKVQTNNKIDLINTIISVDLNQNSDYYVGNGAPGNLAVDVIAAVNQKYPAGFSGLTAHPTSGRLYNFSMISQSAKGAGVAWGTQGSILNNGIPMPVTNVSHVSWVNDYAYDVNTICHEYGHNVWEWTDYYRTAFCNLGMFDLMASAGTNKAPMPINPALRYQRGWIDTVTNISGTLTATYSLQANSYSRMYRYVNPGNPKEYLIFHALKHSANNKYYQSDLYGTPTPEGLAIWYVDEAGGFGLTDNDGLFLVKLVQADNMDQMHDEDATGSTRGDMNDLYGNGNNSFPNGHPWRWKDGGEFGITINNIVKSGNNVNFTVIGRTRTVFAMSDINGTLSPKGVLNVASSTSQAFTFIPYPGYELVDLLVDDMTVPKSNPYTLTGIGATPKSIQPIFDKKANLPALPSPWQKAQFGVTGLATHEAGSFSLESEGGALNGTSDNFTFAYQTLNGNGSIIARVTNWNKPNWNFRAGIMIRESLQSNSVQTMLVKGAYDGHVISQRTASGNQLHNDPNGIGGMHMYNLYNWLKITRNGNEFISYCSRDGVNWVPLAQQTINMPNQVMFGLCVAGGIQFFPARASFDNVSISTTGDIACSFSGTKITGTSIGTEGSWNNSGTTRDKAFDGNILTDFDAPIGNAWTGLSLSSGHRITGIRYYPRRKSANRMVGGKFQGSNTADFSSGVVDLATITVEPLYNWNCVQVTNTSSFAYIRYVGPDGGHGNVAEVEFYGTPSTTNESPIVVVTSPAYGASYTSPANIIITANATDEDGTISKVEFYQGETLLGTDLTYPYSYSVANLPTGTYNFTAIAYDNLNASSVFTVSNIVVSDNAAPTVSITSPVENASYTPQANITINATASDSDGSIWKVEFYNGSTWIGSDFTAPYSYTWNNVPAGVYNLTAIAIDNQNATAAHTVYGVVVANPNQAPTVNITSPVTNASFNAPASITINATAFDADGTITKVEFYNGSTWLASDFTAPYSYTWNNVPAGVYNITALAIDNQNGTASSTRNNIAVIAANTPPTVSLTSPAANASFNAPATVTISANAADANGTVSKVEFFNGTTLLNTDNSAPYSYSWTGVAAGTYSITAKATDNQGAVTTSSAVSITVVNSTADITGPACASNNSTITYELSPAKRANANGYGWYFTGSTQSFNPSGYQTTLITGSNYGAGQVCVGVNLSTSPWYTTYCITVPKCSSARLAETENDWMEFTSANTVSFPNPFENEVTLTLSSDYETASIEVFNMNGIKVHNAQVTGSYTFGNELTAGIYFVKISSQSKTETIKVVKK